jgi:protocatechuate 3,4-dioxygenase beta subunit
VTGSPVDEDLVALLDAGTGSCRVWPEQDQGPYHRDAEPVRRDLVEDRVGVSLRLGIRLIGPNGVDPVVGAVVEIWQCDAHGRYSGFPPPKSDVIVTSQSADRTLVDPDETFLRGRQRTDATGDCQFNTIVPGWYPGRTLHIHVIVHVDGQTFISQMYFPDELADVVLSGPPYDERGTRDTTNAADDIYPTAGDAALLEIGPGADGYRAAICFILADSLARPPR